MAGLSTSLHFTWYFVTCGIDPKQIGASGAATMKVLGVCHIMQLLLVGMCISQVNEPLSQWEALWQRIPTPNAHVC